MASARSKKTRTKEYKWDSRPLDESRTSRKKVGTGFQTGGIKYRQAKLRQADRMRARRKQISDMRKSRTH